MVAIDTEKALKFLIVNSLPAHPTAVGKVNVLPVAVVEPIIIKLSFKVKV